MFCRTKWGRRVGRCPMGPGDLACAVRRRSLAEVAHYNLRMSTSSDRGLFVWHEVGSHDLRASETFYSSLIGWKAEGWDQNPSYRLFKLRNEAKAGLYAITAELNKVPPPPHWLSYIGTPD